MKDTFHIIFYYNYFINLLQSYVYNLFLFLRIPLSNKNREKITKKEIIDGKMIKWTNEIAETGSILPPNETKIHSFELGFLQLHEKVKNHFIESTIQRKDWSISMIPSFFSPFPDGQCRLDSEKTISRPSVFL